MRVAVDTSILAYVEGVNADNRRELASALVRQLPAEVRVLPVQALGELYNVLVRKSGWPSERARAAIAMWCNAFAVIPTTVTAMVAAVDLASDHRLAIWDSVMLAVAAEHGCGLLLSEDFQDGFTWGGVTVANPFAAARHPLLEALLAGK